MGAVLSFGASWESAQPIAFESRQMNGVECNYPVHEQEMLAIMRVLKKWRVDLLGSHIHIHTDHKTPQNFDFQWDLSQRQAHWMEYLSQYIYSITYINSHKNTVADALSRLLDSVDQEDPVIVASAIFSIQSDPKIITRIKSGYRTDPWCMGILDNLKRGMVDAKLNIAHKHNLLFIGNWLVIPKYKNLREKLFQLAHDNLGHFGAEKSYANLRNNFYWPNMRRASPVVMYQDVWTARGTNLQHLKQQDPCILYPYQTNTLTQ
jgi:hypothetical protein